MILIENDEMAALTAARFLKGLIGAVMVLCGLSCIWMNVHALASLPDMQDQVVLCVSGIVVGLAVMVAGAYLVRLSWFPKL